jgi:hypothetical protein
MERDENDQTLLVRSPIEIQEIDKRQVAIADLKRLKAAKARPTTIAEVADRMEHWEKIFGI